MPNLQEILKGGAASSAAAVNPIAPVPAPSVAPVVPAVAAVAPVAPVPTPATTAHALAVGTGPVLAAPVASVAPPISTVPLDGGGRFAGVMDALATASVSSGRNKIPGDCSGSFLLKGAKFKVTEGGNFKLTSFDLLCVVSGPDANGIQQGTQGYSGAITGEVYEDAIFLDMSPQAVKRTLSSILRALRACMGWDEAKVKTYQATPEGQTILANLLAGLCCADINTLIPTNQPCLFTNQVVVNLSTKVSIKPVKLNGQPTFNQDGSPCTKSYCNTYWNGKMPLAEVQAALGDAGIIEAFETAENWGLAIQSEQSLSTM